MDRFIFLIHSMVVYGESFITRKKCLRLWTKDYISLLRWKILSLFLLNYWPASRSMINSVYNVI